MLIRSTILKLPKRLFWDTNYNKIDPDKQYLWVISRVFDYGSWEDVKEVIAYYGEKKVMKSLQYVKYLKPYALSLACSLFNLNPADFKCYTRKQFHHDY
ncbi:MAG: hypothetical protein HYY40_06785 [Bacteroidetes bacterium]|nr:hypothetical protein [Bacteroidota bacterium]